MPRAQTYTKPQLIALQRSALFLQPKIVRKLSFIANYADVYLPPRLTRKRKRQLAKIHDALQLIIELDYNSIR